MLFLLCSLNYAAFFAHCKKNNMTAFLHVVISLIQGSETVYFIQIYLQAKKKNQPI